MESILNKFDIFFTILLGLVQCLYSIRSFRLQKQDSTNQKNFSKRTSEKFSNTSMIDIDGNQNTLNFNQTIVQNNSHNNKLRHRPNLKKQISSKIHTFYLSGILIISYIILSLFQNKTPENQNLFLLSNYVEKVFSVLIQLSNNLLTVSLITSIIVILFSFLFKLKGHLYTGGLFLISSLTFKSYIPYFDVHKILINLSQTSESSVPTAFENIIEFLFIISFILIVFVILFMNISYISNHSSYLSKDSKNEKFKITSDQEKLITPLIPLLTIVIYTYLITFHGVTDVIETLTSIVKYIIQEIKSQMLINQ